MVGNISIAGKGDLLFTAGSAWGVLCAVLCQL